MMEDSGASPLKPSQQSNKSGSTSALGWLRHCDIYTKVDEEYRVQTDGGAILSLVGWVIISILIMSEVNHYIGSNSVPKEHMVVDTKLGQQLEINIDMTYHALTCAEVHMDAMDVAGDNQLNVEHSFVKHRISAEGLMVGEPGVEIIGQADAPNATELPTDYCGDCYGANSEIFKCCNNCDELQAAYNAKGWNTNEIVRTSQQCLRDIKNPFANVRPGEGCRLTGSMKVNKVAGNVHMTIGESLVRDGAHIHQFIPSEAPKFNVSHTIHSFSFGKEHPLLPTTNYLDGTVRMVNESTGGTGLFQYFIRIVPTVYMDKSGQTDLVTNQFTYTEKFRPVVMADYERVPGRTGAAPVIPGIFFVYDLSPFMLQVSSAQIPLSHLVTRLLAIVGGVFCVLGLLDSLWYKTFRGK
mmetsp:Transcript_30815/g.57460  ORF Transcript_30815/g.57460 Transcript_30815/m.57460 type:complete len:410 (-) Transcript_30815:135-1364(-)